MIDVYMKCQCGMHILWGVAWKKGMEEVQCLCKRVWKLTCSDPKCTPFMDPPADTEPDC